MDSRTWLNSWATFCVVLTAFIPTARGQVSDGFAHPGNAYRPKFRYWLPDASVSSETVAKDIASIAEIGAGGIEFIPFYFYGLVYTQIGESSADPPEPPTDWSVYGFGTEAFNDLFKDALKAVQNQGDGFQMDFAVGANQGQGVPSETGASGLAVQLVPGNATVAPGETFSGEVPEPYLPSVVQAAMSFMLELEEFGPANLTAVFAMRMTANATRTGSNNATVAVTLLDEYSYVDLTPYVTENGRLEWTPPDNTSTWRVFSFWEKYTNQRSCHGGSNPTDAISNGSWVVDHFSSAGARKITDFWDEQILGHQETGELLRTVGNNAWEDSMEIVASLYWTPGFLSRFEEQMGYSLVKYLPLLYSQSNFWGQLADPWPVQYQYGQYTLGGESIHNIDYRAVLGSAYQDYVDHFRNWSHTKELRYSNQPAYNLPLEMLPDITHIDVPECESLGFVDSLTSYRQFVGPAHLSNQPIISSEVGAVAGRVFNQTVADLLYHIKRGLAGGINMHVLHGSPYTGNYPNTTWPGFTAFWYQYSEMWNANIQPAWGSGHLRDAMDYIARSQWVLQQGVPKIDLAVYHFSSPWKAGGEDVLQSLGTLGFTYDYLGPDTLTLPQAQAQDGLLAGGDGPGYKALLFASQQLITVEAARAVLDLVKSGMRLVVVGGEDTLPNQTYPSTDAGLEQLGDIMDELASMASSTTSSDSAASGAVHFVNSVEELSDLLEEADIQPRVRLDCASHPVYPVLRSSSNDSVDYIYIYNDQDTPVDCSVSLQAVDDKMTTPYTYNAWTGAREEIVHYTADPSTSRLTMPLSLQANETTVIALKYTTEPGFNTTSVTSTSSNVASLTRNTTTNTLIATIRNHNDTTTTTTTMTMTTAEITLSSNKTLAISLAPLPPPTDLTTWSLTIEDWHAPDHDIYDMTHGTAKTLHHFPEPQPLVPWTALGLTNVSGTGRYTTNFTLPAYNNNNTSSTTTTTTTTLGGLLSLGAPTANTVRVSIDGVALPPIDPTRPATVDISRHVKGASGRSSHELTVEVSTTLFNRVRSMADDIMVWGQVAALQQPLFLSDAPQEYGLLGPVRIEWVGVAELPL